MNMANTLFKQVYEAYVSPPGIETTFTWNHPPSETLHIFWCEAHGGANKAEVIRTWHENTWDVIRYVRFRVKIECMDTPASYKIFMAQIWP